MHQFASEFLTCVKEGTENDGGGGRKTKDQESIRNQKISFGFTMIDCGWCLVSVHGFVSYLSNGNAMYDAKALPLRTKFKPNVSYK